MARLNPRGAAVVGVVSVVLLIGGPGMATVTADPGGSRGGGSDRGSSADRGGGHGRGGSKSNHNHRGDRHDFDRGRRGDDRDDRDNNGGWNRAGSDGPQSRVGSGRELPQQAAPNARAGVAAGAPVSEEPPRANPPAISERSAIASSPPVEAPAPIVPAPETGAAGADGSGPAAGPAAGPANTFEAPRVIVGNGREPGLQSTDPAPRWQGPVPTPAVAPPAPPPAAPPPPPSPPAPPRWLPHFSAPPAVAKQFPVAPTADWTSLWGLIGLLLLPAAGAALGYRQARAVQTADRLHRR